MVYKSCSVSVHRGINDKVVVDTEHVAADALGGVVVLSHICQSSSYHLQNETIGITVICTIIGTLKKHINARYPTIIRIVNFREWGLPCTYSLSISVCSTQLFLHSVIFSFNPQSGNGHFL